MDIDLGKATDTIGTRNNQTTDDIDPGFNHDLKRTFETDIRKSIDDNGFTTNNNDSVQTVND